MQPKQPIPARLVVLKSPSELTPLNTKMVMARLKILASTRGWCGNADCGHCPLRPSSCHFDERSLSNKMIFEAYQFVEREWSNH